MSLKHAGITWLREFASFAVIGALATAIQYATLIVLVEAQLAGAVSASTAGFALSAVANYLLNRRFTFRSTRAHSEAFVRFAVVASVGLGMNASLVWLFHLIAGLHYLVAQVLATCSTLLWNYGANRIWTFPVHRTPREAP
jgi:putative flippase GtrA